MLRDLRSGFRALRRRPLYAVLVVCVLALGIGANVAVYTIVDGVFLSSLPYAEADRLVTLWSTSPRGETRLSVSYPDFRDWNESTESVESMDLAFGHLVVLEERDGPSQVVAAAVTPGFFTTLGAGMELGTPSVGRAGEESPRGVVLKHSTWVRRFGGDPAVVGSAVSLNGTSYTVTGVARKGVDFPSWAEMWMPLTREIARDEGLEDRGQRLDIWVLARLSAGASVEGAASELQVVASRLEAEYGDTNEGVRAAVVPLRDIVLDPWGRHPDLGRAFVVLQLAVGLVLLIACANLATLAMARLMDRRRELAIRSAVGAGRRQLAGQLLTESLLLAVVGGAGGLGVAVLGIDTFLALGPSLPRSAEIGIDARVLLFAVSLVAGVTVLFGVVPALRGASASLRDVHRSGGFSRARGARRAHAALVSIQLALALVLLVASGLLVRSLANIEGIDPGFDPAGLHAMRVPAPARYSTDTERVEFHRTLESEIESLPGVQGAATANHVPGGGLVLSPIEVPGWESADSVAVAYRTVSPDYLETMGIEVVAGRGLGSDDAYPWSGAVVVNRALAEAIGDPLGRAVTLYRQKPGSGYGEPLKGRIVGVASDVRGALTYESAAFTVYLPHTVDPWPRTTLAVRTDPGAMGVATMLRRALRDFDPAMPVSEMRTMEAQLAGSASQPRFVAALASTFGSVAFLLAAVGLGGLVAYTVRSRRREIAIRLALGARRRQLLRMLLGRTALLVSAGTAVGLGASLLANRALGTLLYEVSPTDPLTYGAITLLLVAAALAAGALPLRRILRMEPREALRVE